MRAGDEVGLGGDFGPEGGGGIVRLGVGPGCFAQNIRYKVQNLAFRVKFFIRFCRGGSEFRFFSWI